MNDELYEELQQMGVNVDAVKSRNPTERQLQDLLDGLSQLQASFQK
jgi:hypothetical protein